MAMASNESDEEDRDREVVGVFKDDRSLQEAIDELLTSGFDRAEISLLAGEDTVVEKLGHKYKKVEEIEDDPAVPRADYVDAESIGEAKGALIGGLFYIGAFAAAGAILASGGALATILAGAAAAGSGGALIGAVLGEFIDDHHAKYLQEQIDHGGLLLWVRTRDAARENVAKEILAKHSGRNVHAHTLGALATR
jgi:hypothetical protein